MEEQTSEVEPGEIGSVPTCQTCGSLHVARDAWACFNPESGLWELESTFDQEFCHACEAETQFVWKKSDTVPNLRIRALNDRFRTVGLGRGSVFVTSGIQAMGETFMTEAYRIVRAFSAFSKDNDPWGEHDFGRVEVNGKAVFWKFDYYDLTLTAGSNNPANEGETHRVLTILLPEEY